MATAVPKRKDEVVINYETVLISAFILTMIASLVSMFVIPVLMDSDGREYKQHTCDYSNCRKFLGDMHSQDLKVVLDIQHLNDTATVTTYIPAAKADYLCDATSGPCFSYYSHLELEPFSPYTWKLITFTVIAIFTLIPAAIFAVSLVVLGGVFSLYEYLSMLK